MVYTRIVCIVDHVSSPAQVLAPIQIDTNRQHHGHV